MVGFFCKNVVVLRTPAVAEDEDRSTSSLDVDAVKDLLEEEEASGYFRNEETALRYLGRKLGVKVDCTPKFHCEMAGEGIEYCWAFSKALYRRKPLASKKSRDTFKKLVKECTSASILKPAQCKKFSRRARQYMCAYYILHVRSLQRQEGAQPEEGRAGKQQLQFRSIERMKKLFRSHRCALDFDKGFVEAVIKESAAEAA